MLNSFEAGWLPNNLDFGRRNTVLRRGKARDVPEVVSFLSTIPRGTPKGDKDVMIATRYWDVLGHTINPNLSREERKYAKQYAQELKRHISPEARRAISEEQKQWMFVNKETHYPGFRRPRNEQVERWNRFIAEDDPWRENRYWLHDLDRENIPARNAARDRGVGTITRGRAMAEAFRDYRLNNPREGPTQQEVIAQWRREHPPMTREQRLRKMRTVMADTRTRWEEMLNNSTLPQRPARPERPARQARRGRIARAAPAEVETELINAPDVAAMVPRVPVDFQ